MCPSTILCLMSAPFLALAQQPPGECSGDVLKRELKSFWSPITPTLDGYIAADEWADATSFGSIDDNSQNKWLCEFFDVKDPEDLSLTARVKHTDSALFFAFDVTDNLHYGVDTPRWMPAGNPDVDILNASGWGFFGDEMEILINAAGPTKVQADVAGNTTQWQMVHNAGKSIAAGIGVGGLIPGDRPAQAWDTYLSWIRDGRMHSTSMLSRAHKGYVIEWRIDFSLLELKPNEQYSADMPETLMGLNIALGDVDTAADGDPYYGIRHEQWFSGEKVNRTQINEFGTLRLMPKEARDLSV